MAEGCMSGEGGKRVNLSIWNATTKTWEKFDGSITTGDIAIGQVEIKDYDSDDQLEITSAHAAKVDVVAPSGRNGGPVTIGTSAVEITFTGATKAITIKSASTNTGLIWFGPSNITNTGANAEGELTADSAVTIPLDDSSSAVYCISDTASQTVYKVALT